MELLILWGLAATGIVLFIIQNSSKKLDQKAKAAKEAKLQKAIEDSEHILQCIQLIRQAHFIEDEETVKAYNEERYNGPLPEKQVNGSWSSPYPQILLLPIAGINFRTGIKNCLGPGNARLIADPKNEYDPNAIKVIHESGTHLGFVPEDRTDEIRDLLPCYVMCDIAEEVDDENRHYFYGWIYVNTKPNQQNQ